MFLFDGTVISISFQVEFTESLIRMSGLFAVIVLSVLTGTSLMCPLAHVGTICL